VAQSRRKDINPLGSAEDLMPKDYWSRFNAEDVLFNPKPPVTEEKKPEFVPMSDEDDYVPVGLLPLEFEPMSPVIVLEPPLPAIVLQDEEMTPAVNRKGTKRSAHPESDDTALPKSKKPRNVDSKRTDEQIENLRDSRKRFREKIKAEQQKLVSDILALRDSLKDIKLRSLLRIFCTRNFDNQCMLSLITRHYGKNIPHRLLLEFNHHQTLKKEMVTQSQKNAYRSSLYDHLLPVFVRCLASDVVKDSTYSSDTRAHAKSVIESATIREKNHRHPIHRADETTQDENLNWLGANFGAGAVSPRAAHSVFQPANAALSMSPAQSTKFVFGKKS
jgi:hypothetical protein